MTTTAAGRAVGHRLDLKEGFFHVLKLLALFQRFFNIETTDLLAVTDHIVDHIHTSLHHIIKWAGASPRRLV